MEQSFARNRAKARDASEAIVCFVFARVSGGMTMKTNARSVLYFRFEYLFSLLRILLLNIIRFNTTCDDHYYLLFVAIYVF